MDDACAGVSALEGALEPEMEAMAEVLRAINRWQQTATSASVNRQREIAANMENHVQQAVNAKLQEMEKRLEEKMEKMVNTAFQIMKDRFEEIMTNKIESLVQTYMKNEMKQAETAAAMAREIARNDQLMGNQKHSSSALLSPPVQVGSSTPAKRPAPLPLDVHSATPMKRERPLQEDSTPTPSIADSPSQPPFSFFQTPMQPSSSTLPQLNRPQTALFSAVKAGRINDVVNYLQFNVNPHDRNEEGDTVLHVAVKGYRSKVLKELLVRGGMDVNVVDSSGKTALHVAASQTKGGMYVDILLKQNANVHCTDLKGNTPLHCAARNGHEKTVAKLLGKGAKANAQNSEGLMPIHVAKTDVVRNILSQLWDSPTEPLHPFNCLSTSLSPPYEGNTAVIDGEGSDDDVTEIFVE